MSPRHPGQVEFIALMAMLFSTIAFSIDAMLPALPEFAAAFSPEAPNRAQLVVTSFVLGMGLGTLFTGPLSDRFGRKPVILTGTGLYMISALIAARAETLEALLAARFVQGLGAAGPRVVALAIIRDLYAGRGMARIMSFVMIVFTTVPAIAPSLGAGLIALAGWQSIFWAFVLFSAIGSAWLWLRLPETLAVEDRRPFRIAAIWEALQEMIQHPVVRLSIAVQALSFGMLFAIISTVQPIYEITFDRAHSFHLWFGAVAIVSASSSLINAALVMRLGMRRLVSGMLLAQVAISAAMLAALVGGLSGTPLFALFVFWQLSLFFQAGMTIGNLNAIAMEPMGHIAGLAASVIGGVATIAAVAIAVPIGLTFDGTPLSLAFGIFALASLAFLLMRAMGRAEARLLA